MSGYTTHAQKAVTALKKAVRHFLSVHGGLYKPAVITVARIRAVDAATAVQDIAGSSDSWRSWLRLHTAGDGELPEEALRWFQSKDASALVALLSSSVTPYTAPSENRKAIRSQTAKVAKTTLSFARRNDKLARYVDAIRADVCQGLIVRKTKTKTKKARKTPKGPANGKAVNRRG